MNQEDQLHSGVCKYLKLQYPKVLFNSDMSGTNLHKGIRGRIASLRSSRAMPDLMIFEPKGKYHGLFIELKSVGASLYRKDGFLCANSHLKEQRDLLNILMEKGYYACFCQGFDQAKKVIDWYLA